MFFGCRHSSFHKMTKVPTEKGKEYVYEHMYIIIECANMKTRNVVVLKQ